MEYYRFIEDNIYSKDQRYNYFYHKNNFPFKNLHGHIDYWEFTIVLEGSLKHICNGKEEIITAGHLFFQTTKDIHLIAENDNDKHMVYSNILVRETTLKALADSISPEFFDNLINGRRVFHITEGFIDNIENIVHQINLLSKDEINKYNSFLCSATLLILQRIFLSQISYDSDDAFTRKINKIKNDQQFLLLSVDELADKTGYSRMQLDRLIKKYYNQTPLEFLTTHRIRYAENLLLSTDMSVDEICRKVGYSGFATFSKNFKNKYGVTPLQYRLKNK